MAEKQKQGTEYPLKRAQFSCPSCPGEEDKGAFFFFTPAEEIRQDDHGEYVADCPQCGEVCAELWYMRNVRRTIGRKTGVKTPEGKLKSSMNGFKTGSSYASGAVPRYIPPCKPDKYAECETCQDIDEMKAEVEGAMETCRYVACHQIGKVIAKYRNAHMTGDPESLRWQAAENQAKMQRVANQCFKAIFDNGVMLDADIVQGGKVITTEKRINPAISLAMMFLEKMGFTLNDWTLTPKSKEAKAALDGYLAGQAAAKGQSMDEFLSEHKKHMSDFHKALERGNDAAKNDPTLAEAEREDAEGADV